MNIQKIISDWTELKNQISLASAWPFINSTLESLQSKRKYFVDSITKIQASNIVNVDISEKDTDMLSVLFIDDYDEYNSVIEIPVKMLDPEYRKNYLEPFKLACEKECIERNKEQDKLQEKSIELFNSVTETIIGILPLLNKNSVGIELLTEKRTSSFFLYYIDKFTTERHNLYSMIIGMSKLNRVKYSKSVKLKKEIRKVFLDNGYENLLN